MKGDLHSFHMRHGSLICCKRLLSYESCNFLSFLCLVLMTCAQLDPLSPYLTHSPLVRLISRVDVEKLSVIFRWSLVFFPLATNDHWFSMPVGPLSLAAISLADRRPTKKDRQFCLHQYSYCKTQLSLMTNRKSLSCQIKNYGISGAVATSLGAQLLLNSS